jgi:hypothetical protein
VRHLFSIALGSIDYALNGAVHLSGFAIYATGNFDNSV